MGDMETKDMPHGIVGFDFAQALVMGEFEKAHAFLSAELRSKYTAAGLKSEFESMVEYAQPFGVPYVVVVDNRPLPGISEMDAQGWAYVAIQGEGWSEAVTVTVKPVGNEYLITELVWGRP